ncbi:hypothetical protein B0H13DRAFT_2282128, partial [Mycena leptocephala]
MKDFKRAVDWIGRKKSSTQASPLPVQSNSSSANEPIDRAKSGGTAESLLNILTLALAVAEQVVDIAQVAPVIKPAAELLSKIIEIYKEAKSTSEKRDVLAERIGNLTGDICATVLRMEETGDSDRIGRLKQDLETYAALSVHLIEKASKCIEHYDSWGKIARVVKREQLTDEMDKVNEELKSFGARFGRASAEKLDEVHNRLVELYINQRASAETLGEVHNMATKDRLEEWLRKAPDMTEKQHDTQQLRRGDTGLWFLNGNEFIEWQDNAGVLWIVGHSGAGKSVLCSTAIHKIFEAQALSKERKEVPPAIAFFYYNFRSKE